MMDIDPSCLVTMVLDTDAYTHQVRAIERFVPECFAGMLGWAERLIRQHGIADPAFGADDAVQAALLKTLKAAKDQRIRSMETEEELAKLVGTILKQVVLDARAGAARCKRGGPDASRKGRTPAFCRAEVVDLEAMDSHGVTPDEQVLAVDAVEEALRVLDLFDLSLRVVAIKKTEGFTHREIAAHLDQSLSTIEQRVRLIKVILEPRYPNVIWKNFQNL